MDISDDRNGWVLRARRERPRRGCAAEQRDEVAALHSITSSAATSNPGGTVRSSVLAAAIRRSCYNKAHDIEHSFHTPALLGES